VKPWSQSGRPLSETGIFAAMTGAELQALMDGGTISNDLAREIEWAMHRPEGWPD
jgi:hypothetical protein